jgi:hypothetical protein
VAATALCFAGRDRDIHGGVHGTDRDFTELDPFQNSVAGLVRVKFVDFSDLGFTPVLAGVFILGAIAVP